MLAGRKDGREEIGDARLPFGVRDQILPNLQLEIVQSARVGVVGDREIRVVHGVGLIVTHIVSGCGGKGL